MCIYMHIYIILICRIILYSKFYNPYLKMNRDTFSIVQEGGVTCYSIATKILVRELL